MAQDDEDIPEDEEGNSDEESEEEQEDDDAPIECSEELKERVVHLKSKAGTRTLLMRELDGTGRDEYLDGLGKRSTVQKDGTARFNNLKGVNASLLTKTLFEEKPGKGWVNLTEKQVQALPASTQQKLYDESSKMNGLNKGAEDKAKKE